MQSRPSTCTVLTPKLLVDARVISFNHILSQTAKRLCQRSTSVHVHCLNNCANSFHASPRFLVESVSGIFLEWVHVRKSLHCSNGSYHLFAHVHVIDWGVFSGTLGQQTRYIEIYWKTDESSLRLSQIIQYLLMQNANATALQWGYGRILLLL